MIEASSLLTIFVFPGSTNLQHGGERQTDVPSCYVIKLLKVENLCCSLLVLSLLLSGQSHADLHSCGFPWLPLSPLAPAGPGAPVEEK